MSRRVGDGFLGDQFSKNRSDHLSWPGAKVVLAPPGVRRSAVLLSENTGLVTCCLLDDYVKTARTVSGVKFFPVF